MERSPVLEAILNGMKPNRKDDLANKRCVMCHKDATTFDSDLSRKEYGISGMCQTCQNDFFGES